MRARINKVRREYGVEIGVAALVMTAVMAYAYFGSLLLGSY
jgi:hypothetical protein